MYNNPLVHAGRAPDCAACPCSACAFACALLLSTAAFADDSLTFGISQPYAARAAEKVPAVVELYLSKALRPGEACASEEASPTRWRRARWTWRGITPLAFVRASQ